MTCIFSPQKIGSRQQDTKIFSYLTNVFILYRCNYWDLTQMEGQIQPERKVLSRIFGFKKVEIKQESTELHSIKHILYFTPLIYLAMY